MSHPRAQKVTDRRQFLRTAGVAAALPRSGSSQGRPGTRPPNVIILLSDDQGYGDLSCHGNPALKTPSMDRLHGWFQDDSGKDLCGAYYAHVLRL